MIPLAILWQRRHRNLSDTFLEYLFIIIICLIILIQSRFTLYFKNQDKLTILDFFFSLGHLQNFQVEYRVWQGWGSCNAPPPMHLRVKFCYMKGGDSVSCINVGICFSSWLTWMLTVRRQGFINPSQYSTEKIIIFAWESHEWL